MPTAEAYHYLATEARADLLAAHATALVTPHFFLDSTAEWTLDPAQAEQLVKTAFYHSDRLARGAALAAMAEATSRGYGDSLSQNAFEVIVRRFLPPAEWGYMKTLSYVCEWVGLNHKAAARRRAALIAAGRRSDVSNEVREAVLKLVASDANEEVRMQAIKAAVRLYRRTKDHDALRIIAGAMQQPSCSEHIRVSAYGALFQIADRPRSEWPGIRALRAGSDPCALRDDEIDWTM